MRLVLIHGINSVNSSSQRIIDAWRGALGRSWASAELELFDHQEVSAPYYGDTLAAEVERLSKMRGFLTPQSLAAVQGDERAFYDAFLVEASERQCSLASFEAEAGLIDQGQIAHNEYAIAIARTVDAVKPLGSIALSVFLPQASAYLHRSQASEAVDNIVMPELLKGPCIVVAHSLGSVIAYKLLRQCKQLVPLYLTMGSPLGTTTVQSAIGRPYYRPKSIAFWLNAHDRHDFVTAGRSLDLQTFGSGVNNIEVRSVEEDPHDVNMYLASKEVSRALVDALA